MMSTATVNNIDIENEAELARFKDAVLVFVADINSSFADTFLCTDESSNLRDLITEVITALFADYIRSGRYKMVDPQD